MTTRRKKLTPRKKEEPSALAEFLMFTTLCLVSGIAVMLLVLAGSGWRAWLKGQEEPSKHSTR